MYQTVKSKTSDKLFVYLGEAGELYMYEDTGHSLSL